MKITIPRAFRYVAVVALMWAGVATTISSGGGGGGGGVQPPPPTGSGPTLTITADNGDEVASALLIAIGGTFDLGDISGGGVTGLGAPAPLTGVIRKNTSVLSSTTRNQIEPCISGGTIDITATLANPPLLTVGDHIIAVFDNCDNNDGYVISGTVDLTIAALQGDTGTDVFLLGLDVLMTDVVIFEGGQSFTADGDFTLTVDALAFPVITMTIGGQELILGAGAETATMTNFDHSLTVDAGVFPDTKTAEASGRMLVALLGGSVDYETTALIHAIGDFDPHEGEILVTGASGSSVRIVVVDNVSVRLEIDANGDGVVDQFVDTSWSALTGSTPTGGGDSTINSTNLPIVAREVFNAITGFGSVAFASGSQFTPDAVFTLVQQQGVSGSFGPLTINCLTSGTADVSGLITTAGTYSAGDSLDANFAACVRGAERLDGAMLFNVGSFNGTVGSAVSVTGNVTETNLRRGADGTCHVGLGSFVTSFDVGFANTGFITAGSTADTFDISAGGRHQILSNASVSALITIGQPGTVSRESSGTLTGTDLTGSFGYASIVPDVFVVDGDSTTGPSSGELLVVASDGSSMRMVAVDNLNVRLDADYDGDTMIDEQVFTTYATLGYGNVFGLCDLDMP